MGQAQKQTLYIEKFAENLATFAINRDDLKELLKPIPENSDLNLTTIEYELQILKIISVGWSISFYLPHSDENKKPLSELYWTYIREISKDISNLTGTTTGQQIDYFSILKQRLDNYISVLQQHSEASSGTSGIIGSVFADLCNVTDNPAAMLTGTKMFTYTIGSIKEYLGAVEIIKPSEADNEN